MWLQFISDVVPAALAELYLDVIPSDIEFDLRECKRFSIPVVFYAVFSTPADQTVFIHRFDSELETWLDLDTEGVRADYIYDRLYDCCLVNNYMIVIGLSKSGVIARSVDLYTEESVELSAIKCRDGMSLSCLNSELYIIGGARFWSNLPFKGRSAQK